jgi:outer membrane murein-binding lipoprotein Lpp
VYNQVSEHQKYVEMCALYMSGNLSDEQLRSLDDHLEGCLDCRRAFNEFQEIASIGMAALSPDMARESTSDGGKPVAERTTRRLLARIENEIHARQSVSGASATYAPLRDSAYCVEKPSKTRKEAGSFLPLPFIASGLTKPEFSFPRTLLACAAAVLFSATISIYSYRQGARKVANVSAWKLRQVETAADSLGARIAELSTEREALRANLQEAGNTISALKGRIKLQLNEIMLLKEEEERLAERAQGAESQRLASDSERDVLNRKLAKGQESLATMQKDLEQAREQQSNNSLLAARLQNQLDGLSIAIRDRDQTIRRQRDLLAYDRDVRDLIGARDLYVAEVTDVDRDAQTERPFGRIFFTKGKSLIFYAYDLDSEPGVKGNSLFAAWGRRDYDFEHSIPLGIFYRDNSTQRRWVLKFDNPKTLAMIDAVFVTVEPGIGRKKPAGKPLLFAYLKVKPNHP